MKASMVGEKCFHLLKVEKFSLCMYVRLLKVERQVMLAIKMILSAGDLNGKYLSPRKFTCSLFSIKVKNIFL